MERQLKLYDQLLQFPLFQGMSRSELLQMAGNTRFGFVKMESKKLLVHEGDACTQLFFLISGSIALHTQSDDHSYTVVEHLSAPYLLQPDALFGLNTRYRHKVVIDENAHFITLAKDEVMRLLDDFLIFRLNLLNLLSTRSQRENHRFWRRAPLTLEARILRFFVDHCSYPAGAKEFHILMEQLAVEVGSSRLSVSRVLNDLEHRGILKLYRGLISIPTLEHLFM